MQEDTNESKTFDVQYSIRLPEDLASEINARAAADGVKPSTWIRNCITSAIKQKNEVNADMFRAPLLMLLKEDKSVRALIRDIVNEKLPETTQLRKHCELLTISMSDLTSRLRQEKVILESFREELIKTDDRIRELTNEIGVLKQMSHGSENNEAAKAMIKKYLHQLEEQNAHRSGIAADIQKLEISITDNESLLERLKKESLKSMQKLESLAGSSRDTGSGKEKEYRRSF